MAKSEPPVGADCLAIGMPGYGLLWTLRTGKVAGHGLNRDVIDQRFQLGDNEQLSVREQEKLTRHVLAKSTKSELTLTTCRLFKGDSGGPLLDMDGKVSGVTWGGPPAPYDKFSYHVHLKTLREFLSSDGAYKSQRDPPSTLPVLVD